MEDNEEVEFPAFFEKVWDNIEQLFKSASSTPSNADEDKKVCLINDMNMFYFGLISGFYQILILHMYRWYEGFILLTMKLCAFHFLIKIKIRNQLLPFHLWRKMMKETMRMMKMMTMMMLTTIMLMMM